MTPEEVEAGLLKHGFVEVEEFKDLKRGTRVCHTGQRWPQAVLEGTGNVERIFRQPKGMWERKYGRPNVELFVKKDDGDYMFVADYHVMVVRKS